MQEAVRSVTLQRISGCIDVPVHPALRVGGVKSFVCGGTTSPFNPACCRPRVSSYESIRPRHRVVPLRFLDPFNTGRLCKPFVVERSVWYDRGLRVRHPRVM